MIRTLSGFCSFCLLLSLLAPQGRSHLICLREEGPPDSGSIYLRPARVHAVFLPPYVCVAFFSRLHCFSLPETRPVWLSSSFSVSPDAPYLVSLFAIASRCRVCPSKKLLFSMGYSTDPKPPSLKMPLPLLFSLLPGGPFSVEVSS